jgi:spore maturation protein A
VIPLINWIWLFLILIGFLTASLTGRLDQTTKALFTSTENTVMFCVGLVGILAFWSGLMRIADESGLTQTIARLTRPILKRFFPTLPSGGAALGAIAMSLAANILGISNAATPLGLRAMEELEKVNAQPKQVSPAISTYLSLIVGGLTIVPTTVIAFRAKAGSAHPDDVLIPILLATLSGTIGALFMNWLLGGGRRP